jgi:hypothetical protein
MSKKIEISPDYKLALLPGAGALVSMEKTIKPVRPVVTIEQQIIPDDISYWGETNNFPKEVIDDLRKDPELGQLINKQSQLLYSGGLEFGTIEKDSSGNEILIPLTDKVVEAEIKLWLRRTNINRYLMEGSRDLYTFYNVFPELTLARDRSKVLQLSIHAAEECRWSKQDVNTGLVNWCYINAQWDKFARANSTYTKKVPVLDPYYAPAENLKSDNRGLHYIYPISYPTPGNKFYQLADWNAIRSSGWLEVSQLIPKFKNALLKNQTVIKYHIQISDQYWKLAYTNWDTLKAEEQAAKKLAVLTEIQEVLAGADRAGKNFWSVFRSDIVSGKDNDLIKITALDDKLKSGQYLEEGKDASVYKMASIGMHPALVGTMPSTGLGAAGSDIREAFNLHMLTNRPHQHLLLEPLYLVSEYNGWPSDIEWRLKNTLMTTLDAGKETKSAKQ